MRLYQKGDQLHFVHKASMVMDFLGVKSNGLFFYRELPKGARREDYHRVSFEVVKTKNEMATMKAKMKKAREAIHAAAPAGARVEEET